MASANQDPTVLSISTRLPPAHRRTHSRSPSRSPTRKAQFAAKELDPLLKNLSPDSTLEALQKTDTITSKQAEQNALSRSISDASTAERELGVRAAVAAKKLREWQREISTWQWPSEKDASWGAGFIPPRQPDDDSKQNYFGSLSKATLAHYDERLEEIWDAIETLGLEDIKKYVFSSHVSPTQQKPKEQLPSFPTGYGRMRDFTALITATVVQALPDLAHLNVLLETWSIRLNVCREIPDLLKNIESTKAGVKIATNIIRDSKTGPLVTAEELDTTQVILDNNVASLGKRVDGLLDQLEGQVDVLPQAWIDAVEDLERKYAEWVVEAKHIVLRNETARSAQQDAKLAEVEAKSESIKPQEVPSTVIAVKSENVKPQAATAKISQNAITTSPTPSNVKRKPVLELNPMQNKGHKRGVSEVSVADSILSGYSIENAEISQALSTPLLPSPKVSVIDPFSRKSGESWMRGGQTSSMSPQRPSMLQRASTASIEVIPKTSVKEVNLRRSASHDMLSHMRETPPDTPRKALRKLIGADSTHTSPSKASDTSPLRVSHSITTLMPLTVSPSPSLRVDPLNLQNRDVQANPDPELPPVPRRSSKRLSYTISHSSRPVTPSDKAPVEHAIDDAPLPAKKVKQPVTPPNKIKSEATLDDKIRGILTSLPAKIRMTEDSDSASSETASESPTSESSPAPALKLSPVKDKTRHGNSTSAIRVYHLSRSGKNRDAPPIKLFVRAVGEHGERVMVRVGGGWADLKEYLREYSLHHGGRGFNDGQLEVANFPGKNKASLLTGDPGNMGVRSVTPAELEGRVSSMANSAFDFGPLVDLTRVKTASPQPMSAEEYYNAPPMPPEPKTYTMEAPTMITRSSSEGELRTDMHKPPEFDQLNRPQPQPVQDPEVPQTIANNLTSGNVATSTMISTAPLASPMTTPYTPLGAAGPVQNTRRIASHGVRPTQNDGQVPGSYNRSRAVSGQNVSVVQGPTTTTTTTVTSRYAGGASNPRRVVSANPAQAPVPTMGTGRATPIQSPAGSLTSNTSKTSQRPLSRIARSATPDSLKSSKGRMSLGDVSGIKRVFLRRKSSK